MLLRGNRRRYKPLPTELLQQHERPLCLRALPRRPLNRSTLCIARSGPRGDSDRSCRKRAGNTRNSLAHHLGAASRRYGKVCFDFAACRQQRGGRHAGPYGACLACFATARGRCHFSWHHQRRTVLWRCNYYTRAVGAFCDRRTQNRDARIRRLHRAADSSDPRIAFCRAVTWNGKSCGLFWSDHACVVCRDCGRRSLARRPKSDSAAGIQSVVRGINFIMASLDFTRSAPSFL